MKLKQAQTSQDLQLVEQLYDQSFPDSERKPFDMILSMQKTGNADILMMMDPDFCGLLITMKDKEVMLIDYLAVDPEKQSRGYGSRALSLFGEQFPDQPVVLEIENPEGTAPDSQENRRLAFYRRNGFSVMDYTVLLFDVPMKILVRRGSISFQEYQSFLLRRLGSWALEHIQLTG
ncbi:GNAT family N-acetyltransferase [uncultured Faecalibaculum sp.]|uniref:GNAT family N-acetyltransferase n=1 Tax=uncultured Faecalibaculum sp. TaxID=1729681 RepID=UPI0025F2CBEC|nr:GNAT family N-acetyltransferase [uncultured Faecalibaculum sp.]